MRRPVEPEAIGFGDFMQAYRVRPADVQRDYVWSGQQVSELLGDLFGYLDRKNQDIASPGYFIGSFVGYADMGGELRLYDGLQRTITLTLLIAIVRDLLGDEPLADALHDCICDPQGAFRFEIGGEDETLIRHVQPRGATAHWPRTQKVFNRFVVIEEARRTILETFSARGILDRGTLSYDGRSMLRGLAAVLTTDLYIVHLNAETRDIALRMFETVNMRGVTMDDVDLIKTRLPGIAGDSVEAEALIAGWDRLRGRVRYDFRAFVLTVDVIFRNLSGEPEPDPFHALTDWMAEKRGNHPQVLGDWFNTLLHYADAWNDIHAVQQPRWMGSPGLQPLRPVWVIDWVEWKPYALMLVRKWQRRRARARGGVTAANDWLAERLSHLQKACMALEIARDEPKRRRAYFYGARTMLGAGDAAAIPLPPILPPRQRRIRNTLSGPLEDRTLRLRLLTWLEAMDDPSAIPKLLKNGAETPTVEHILPQNPPPGSDWYKRFPDTVTVRRSRNLLGNLALIPSGLNTTLDNKSYAEKQAVMASSLGRLKGYATAVGAFKEPVWDQAAIDRRTQALGEAVWAALGLGGDQPQFITDAAAEAEKGLGDEVSDSDDDEDAPLTTPEPGLSLDEDTLLGDTPG
ncbi:MAG: DUF262 domain-containing HNH endonuclease family protein [Pseudomonadota bacterium]